MKINAAARLKATGGIEVNAAKKPPKKEPKGSFNLYHEGSFVDNFKTKKQAEDYIKKSKAHGLEPEDFDITEVDGDGNEVDAATTPAKPAKPVKDKMAPPTSGYPSRNRSTYKDTHDSNGKKINRAP
jgi:hypothetical protein